MVQIFLEREQHLLLDLENEGMVELVGDAEHLREVQGIQDRIIFIEPRLKMRLKMGGGDMVIYFIMFTVIACIHIFKDIVNRVFYRILMGADDDGGLIHDELVMFFGGHILIVDIGFVATPEREIDEIAAGLMGLRRIRGESTVRGVDVFVDVLENGLRFLLLFF